MEVLVLTEREVRELAGPAEALDAARDAFSRLGRGEAVLPEVMSFDLVEQRGEAHVKGAYLIGDPCFAVKVATGFYGNPERGLPVTSGAFWAFDAETGRPKAILFDNGYLTELRTGAAGALAADLLARPEIERVGILGSGGQARFQLEALAGVRSFARVTVWGRTTSHAERYAEEMRGRLGVSIAVVSDARAAVEGSDLVITTTPSREPILRAAWLSPGMHVTAMGSDLPEKRELEPEALAGATVVADSLAQCLTQGEIHHAVDAGAIRPGDVHAELGDVAAGFRPGRTREDEITIADLTGVGVLDAAMASLVVRRAAEAGAGTTLEV